MERGLPNFWPNQVPSRGCSGKFTTYWGWTSPSLKRMLGDRPRESLLKDLAASWDKAGGGWRRQGGHEKVHSEPWDQFKGAISVRQSPRMNTETQRSMGTGICHPYAGVVGVASVNAHIPPLGEIDMYSTSRHDSDDLSRLLRR